MMLERITFMVRVFVVTFFISLAILGNSYGATYYVSKSGNNSNSCTSPGSGACLSIAGGAAKMSSGDTLLIQAGTYTEAMDGNAGFPWRNGTSSQYTRYARYQNDSVIVKPSGGSFLAFFTAYNQFIELDGLILDGSNVLSNAVKFDGIDTTNSAHNIRIKNGQVRNAGINTPYTSCNLGQSDVSGGAMGILSVYSMGYSNEILNVEIHHNVCYGIYGINQSVVDGNLIHDNGAYGIHGYGGINNMVIRNNRVYNNGYNSSQNGSSVTTPGILIGSGSGSLVYNNLVYGNSGEGIQVGFNGASNIGVYNNSIYNNADLCIYVRPSATSTTVRNNICWQNSNNTIGNDGSGSVINQNLLSNPLFVNAASADFHLQAGSPARNAGVMISQVTTGFDGTTRPQESGYDIGAYEYIQGLPQPTNFRIVSK
jgi:hypothetical protein